MPPDANERTLWELVAEIAVAKIERNVTGKSTPIGVKDRLLDAAEGLFAERGYHPVSVREVAAAANLKLSSFTYHFPSKDNLFSEVVGRRSTEYLCYLRNSLADAIPAVGAPRVEDVIRAFLKPSLQLMMTGGQGWSNYIQLICRAVILAENEIILGRFWGDLLEIQSETFAAFRLARPKAQPVDLHWSVYFLLAATNNVLTKSALLDRHLVGIGDASGLDQMLDRMTTFFSAGFDGLTAPATKRSNRLSHAAS